MAGNVTARIDWLTVLICLLLVAIGWVNIYSSTFTEGNMSLFNFSALHGKQLFFIGVCFCVVLLILALEVTMFERFSSVAYFISILSLLGLFIFGKTVAGATSWYNLGFFNLQPSELAKVATVLALAKYLSDIQTDIRLPKHQAYAFLILLIPAFIIVPQPDPGSALVFFALIFVLFREGLSFIYLLVGLFGILVFSITLMFGSIWVIISLGLIICLVFLLKKKTLKVPLLPVLGTFVLAILFSYSINFVFNSVFEQRHRDRISLWLRLEKDPIKLEKIKRDFGYNIDQSQKAIESGGFWGKGFLEGTRTKGDFVPEQHSDYIYSTVGEEWGFVGTVAVVILFTTLLFRLVFLAERQKNAFSRMYGYGVVSILFIHYLVNIGMVIGLLPTVGIPLPFLSYGGSSLLGFTLLVFIFLKLDSNRVNEWG